MTTSTHHTPEGQDADDLQLNAFWSKAMAAAPTPSIDAQRLALARTAIFAAAAKKTPPTPTGNTQTSNLLRRLSAWWRGSRTYGPPRWATGFASIMLASLVLLLWYERVPQPQWDSEPAAPSQEIMATPADQSVQAAMPAATVSSHSPIIAPAPAPAPAEPSKAAQRAPSQEKKREQTIAAAAQQEQRIARAPMSTPSSVTLYGGQADAIPNALPQQQQIVLTLHQFDTATWQRGKGANTTLTAQQKQALQTILRSAASAISIDQSHAPIALQSIPASTVQIHLVQQGSVHHTALLSPAPSLRIRWLDSERNQIAHTIIDQATYNRIMAILETPEAPATSSK
ncbi:hypothetical protein E9531_11205 [Lampropedia puyangensis]|uniref:Uncharacterized protein n=1 Tax=Lampropedia puyangensis TaxID=1330072 RepID=A0A4V4GR34_9BURK|nr:hypothetical protein [Lampropedia puyangensis]THT99895.1 hypothetical protein E9531_11205 [Lampropedia puyangensis]